MLIIMGPGNLNLSHAAETLNNRGTKLTQITAFPLTSPGQERGNGFTKDISHETDLLFVYSNKNLANLFIPSDNLWKLYWSHTLINCDLGEIT